MIQSEFTLRDKQFRVNMSSIDMLSLSYCMEFDNVKKTSETFTFILEHIEVQIVDKWVQVKATGRDEYFPVGIEEDLSFLRDIEMHFITNILMPAFQKSN